MKLSFAAALTALSLLSTAALAEVRTVTVTAALQSPGSLPDGSVLTIELLDVSRADAPSTTLSEQTFHVTALPVTTELPYESDLIDDRMTYAVAATLRSGETLLARTTSAHTVLTRGAGDSVEAVLETMTMSSGTEPVEPDTTWTAFEIGGRMLVVDNPPTMTILEDGKFSFFGGCNQFSGQADISDGNFTVTQPIAGTRKACPPPMSTVEEAMIEAIGNSVGYVRNGELLTLVNRAGVATVRFKAS